MTALIGYARVSKADGSHDLQRDALIKAGVLPDQIHGDAERELISERTKASLAAARARQICSLVPGWPTSSWLDAVVADLAA